MPSTVLPGGIRISVPEGVRVTDRGADQRRGATRRGPGEAPRPAESVEAALTNSGFEVTRAFDLDVNAAPPVRAGRRAAPGSSQATLDVALDPTQQAALLLEEDGFYSWQLPVAPPQAPPARTRRGAPGAAPVTRTATFEIPFGDAPVRRGARRSVMGKVLGKGTVWVLKFVGPPALGKAVRFFEKDRRTGLVHFTSADASGWVKIDDPKKLPKVASDRPRVLLFVHGTFSSIRAGFGSFSATENGRRFLDEALGKYDLVIGYDHRTLSVDPAENATELLEDLQKAFGDQEPVFHAIAHSRGALVVRSFAEKILPASGWGATIEKVVLAGPTNKGTALAEPENWTELIDLYTNLTNVGAQALSLAGPHAALAGDILADVLDAVGSLVKTLASQAVTDKGIPGLAAMEPDGAFVSQINLAQPGQPTPDDLAFYVLTSNFDVTLMEALGAPGKFPARLMKFLSDGLMDQLMDVDNDLVVDVASMSSIDLPESFIKGSHDFGRSGIVHHTNYFAQPEVIEKMTEWLGLNPAQAAMANGSGGHAVRRNGSSGGSGGAVSGGGASPGLESMPARSRPTRRGALPPMAPRSRMAPPAMAPPAMAPPPSPAMAPPPPGRMPSRSRMAPPADALAEMDSPEMDLPGAGPPEAAPPAADRAAASPPAVKVNAGAHMPGEIKLKELAPLIVQISREAIADLGPGATASGGIVVDAARDLTITATGLLNLEVEGEARVTVPVPAPGTPTEIMFDVRAKAAGPAAIQVIVQQGPARMVRLKVEPTVVSGAPAPGNAQAPAAGMSGNAAAEDRCQLLITEKVVGTETSYEFHISLPVPNEGTVQVHGTSKPIKGDKQQYVDHLFKRIEDAWTQNDSQVKAFETQLKSFGGELWDELIPANVGKLLWKHRNLIDGIQVFSSEPFIPWEIVHLKDPKTGVLPAKTMFLGQLGLCRWLWMDDQKVAPEKLQMRRGKFSALVPVYPPVPGWELNTETEFNHLKDTYGATRVSADPNDLTKLLKASDKFDVLHYAGHGAGDQGNISEERIILEVAQDATGGWAETAYHSSVVAQNAVLAKPAGRRPLVFLNACQAGRIGYQLTGLGGFAQAFIKAGAGVFVGALWSVGDEPAISFSQTFYAEIAAGSTLAEASKAARSAAKVAGEPTWLAYTIYGDPFARVSR